MQSTVRNCVVSHQKKMLTMEASHCLAYFVDINILICIYPDERSK